MKKTIRIVSMVVAFFLLFQTGAVEIAKAMDDGEVTRKLYRNSYTGEIITSEKATRVSETVEDLKGEQSATSADEEQEVRIIEEDASMRDAYTKHFINEGGSFTAVKYSEPIHYRANGVWLLADHTPILQNDGSYTVTKTETPISFPADMKNGAVILSAPDGTVSFKILTEKSSDSLSREETNVEVKTEKVDLTEKSENDRVISADTKHSTVTYHNVFANADLQYETSPSMLKENIIVLQNTESYTYSFSVDFGSYFPDLNENGGIDLYRDKEQKALALSILPPYMYDANGEMSEDVRMTLEKQDDSFVLTVSADAKWVNDQERAFPVVIDPTFDLASSKNDVSDTHVNKSRPTKNYDSDYQLEVGKNLTGTFRTYIKYALPQLPTSSIVTHADLELVQNWSRSFSHDEVHLNVYSCPSSWSLNSITWNNQPISNTSSVNPVDYTDFVNGMSHHYVLNVTKIVKDWYETGVNNGLMLALSDESVSEKTSFYSSRNIVSAYPMITVSYVNNTGLEDYWDYKSADLGDAGTAYVNTYTGGLIYTRKDVSTNGLVFPVSVSHVFLNEKDTLDGIYGNMKFGKGFSLNLIEKIESAGLENYYFKYTDADGTVHYFKSDGMCMEDNTNVHIIFTEGAWGILYPDGSWKKFNSDGLLTSIIDRNSNTIHINYSNGKITSVQDGAGKTIQLTYNSNNYLTAITDPAGRSTTYAYNAGGYLTGITTPDGRSVTLTYSNGHLSTIDSANHALTVINYTNVNNGTQIYQRVSKLLRYEENNSESIVDCLFFGYDSQETWIQYDNGETNYERDNLIVSYDTLGRAVNYRLNNKKIAAEKYNGSVSNNTLHSLSYASDSIAVTHEIVDQSEFVGYVTSNAGAYEISGSSNDIVCNECSSLMGGVAENGTPSDYYYHTSMTAQAGKTYSFAVYLLIQNTLSSGSVYLKAEALRANGQVLETVYSEKITSTDNQWRMLNATMTAPVGTASIRISYGLFQGVGVFYSESVHAEEADAIGYFNFVDGSTFSNTWPNSGSYTNALSSFYRWFSTTGGVSAVTNTGNYTRGMKITGDQNQERTAYQSKAINGKAGDVLLYGASAAAACSASGNDNGDAGRFFGVRLKLYQNGVLKQSEYVPYNTNCPNAYQTAIGTMKANYDYNLFQIELCYNYEINSAVFDDVFVYRGAFGTNYSYGNGGYPSVTEHDSGNKATYTFNGSDLTNVVSSYKGMQTQAASYTYDAHHNLLTATGQDNVTTTYEYPSSGNKGVPTSIAVSDANQNLTSTTAYTFTDNYNYLHTVTDSAGETVTYTYDTTRGLLTSTTDPNGNVTNYTYDTTSDQLLSVSNPSQALGTPTTTFTYSNGRIASMANSDVSYGITYNGIGQTQSVSVQGQQISSSQYNSDYLLSAQTYANGGTASYSYTKDHQLASESYDETTAYTYHYNAQGQLARVEDCENDTVWQYYYDLAGRPVSGGNSNGIDYLYKYNNKGLFSKLTVTDTTDQTSVYQETCTYNAQNRPSIFGSGPMAQQYAYDSLGRVTGTTTMMMPNCWIDTAIVYADVNGQTTNRVSSFTNRRRGNGVQDLAAFQYEYDANGNIAQVQEGADVVAAYTYDGLNRLVREDNLALDKTVLYTYDTGGDIVSKTEYPYQDTNATPTATILYGYDDSATSVWRNGMTSYNGESIVYDANGNPTTYRGYTMTWQKGRQLAAAQKTGLSASYKYDFNGLRTQKTVNGVTTDYLYWGDRLISQKCGTDRLMFSYTTEGGASGFSYQGEKYKYLLNLQGDVVGICDTFGNVVVRYDYDAWGKLISTTGTLASTIGAINPLRYRGYYYDTDTGFYYLQSRYYDPETCKFLNADSLLVSGDYLTGLNLFSYCCNNPVMFVDPTGKASDPNTIVVAQIILSAFTISALLEVLPYENVVTIVEDFVSSGDSLDVFINSSVETVNSLMTASIMAASKNRGKDDFIPRKDPKKGSENRQPTNQRERNKAHPNGEEHSIKPKGSRVPKQSNKNSVTKAVAIGAIAGIIIYEALPILQELLETTTSIAMPLPV